MRPSGNTIKVFLNSSQEVLLATILLLQSAHLNWLTVLPSAVFAREFVVACLPQLSQLDGVVVERSERILALQRLEEVARGVARQELGHRARREGQREEHRRLREGREAREQGEDPIERRKKFFEEKSAHCPETKLEMQVLVVVEMWMVLIIEL